VEIFRRLAAADPDQYRADVARSLQVLAHALDGLDRAAEAEGARADADLTLTNESDPTLSDATRKQLMDSLPRGWMIPRLASIS